MSGGDRAARTPDPATGSAVARTHVLVVDDEGDIAETTALMLEERGLDTVWEPSVPFVHSTAVVTGTDGCAELAVNMLRELRPPHVERSRANGLAGFTTG